MFPHPDAFDSEFVAAQLEGRRKRRRYCYLAWLCVGSHYLYLRRPITQLFFWLTLGGLLLWWLRDLFRVPDLVRRHNQRAMAKLLKSLHAGSGRRVPEADTGAPWPAHASFDTRHPEPLAAPLNDRPPAEDVDRASPPQRDWSSKNALGAIMAAAIIASLVMYVATPPPLQSRSALEPTFRTIRKVNVREAPSTAGPIRAVIGRDVILKGRVEKAGSTQWLWITRGAQADRYVALRNLEKA